MENNDKIPFYVAPDKFMADSYRIHESENVKKIIGQSGFTNICQARILGLSYTDYIEFCEKNYGGYVNESKYGYTSPVIRFKNETLAKSLCLLLNKRWGEMFNV